MINLTPSVFIGIGTSGLGIISNVRELLYEEFLLAGFPCVRFAHISSDFQEKPKILTEGEVENEWEKIQELPICLLENNLGMINKSIIPKSPNYLPNLAKWINPAIPAQKNISYTSGMGNIRQAGRLGLWWNWTNTISALDKVIGATFHQQNAAETNDIIVNQYLKRRNPGMQVNFNVISQNTFNVFIVGSLCGGTCSGTFLDIAFHIKNKFPAAKIYGVFTMPDSQVANEDSYSRKSANTYAALVELDYYMHSGTTFNYIFPNSVTQLQNRANMNPYDYVSLLTLRNKDGSITPILDKSGTPSFDNLHMMAATALFIDVIGGGGQDLNSIRINYLATGQLSQNVNNKPRYIKFFSSFGSSALWFPKSKISRVATEKYIQGVCQRWIGNTDAQNNDDEKLNSKADELLLNLQNTIKNELILVDSRAATTIRTDWMQDLKLQEMIDSLEPNIKSELTSRPNDRAPKSTVASRFKRGGYYFDLCKQKVNNILIIISEKLSDEIEQLITSVINDAVVDTPAVNWTLSEIQLLPILLISRINSLANKSINISEDDITFSELDGNFTIIDKESSRKLVKLVDGTQIVLRKHYNYLREGIVDLLSRNEQILIEYYTKIILDNFSTKIVSLVDERIGIVRERVNEIKNVSVQKMSHIDFRSYPSLVLISKSGVFSDDIENCYGEMRLQQLEIKNQISRVKTLILNSQREGKEIYPELAGKIQKEALQTQAIVNFSILKNTTAADQITTAQTASPMFVNSHVYSPIPVNLNDSPTLIAGGANTVEIIKTNVNANNPNAPFARLLHMELDHILAFYREEAGIAISEFEVFETLKAQAEVSHEFGIYNDVNSQNYDIERFLNIQDLKSERKFKISIDLFKSEIFEEDKNGIFKFSYRSNQFGGVSQPMEEYFSTDQEERFNNFLIEDYDAWTHFHLKFNNAIKQLNTDGVHARIEHYLEDYCIKNHSEKTDEIYLSERKFYYNFLGKQFPRQ